MALESYSIIGLGVLGFLISLFIFYKKQTKQKLVCIIGEDCDKVVRSKYSTIFGIDNAILGMLYFLFIIAVGAGEIIFPSVFALDLIILGKKIATGLAALFSAFLLGVQLIILKEWCEYCIATSIISIIIFLLVVF